MSWWSTDDPRRLTIVVAVLLAAAAIVGLGVGLLLGFAGDGGSTTAASRTASPDGSGSPTATPTGSSASPTARAASQIEAGATSDVGYFVASRRAGDGVHVTFDRVVLRTGAAARDYARRYHKKAPGPDGVLLVNDNTLKRDLVLSPDVKVMGTKAMAGTTTPTEVALKTLRDAIASQGPRLLLDLRYDPLGYVVQVTEHDLP
ncbi:MAG: hypothetical protein ACXV4A_14570 [Actinomycetes bacterium]